MIKSCKQQVDEFKKSRYFEDAKLENFCGVDGYDIYNPTAPFIQNGKKIIAARVEQRENEKSRTMFFEQIDNDWCLVENAPCFNLQDPAIAFVDGDIVLSGIEYPLTIEYNGQMTDYGFVTKFYMGKNIYSLKHIFDGPKCMKDIRLCELPNKKVVFFTRPLFPLKRIGIAIFNSIYDVTSEALDNAEILEGHFFNEEWGGTNQIIVLDDENLGVIGHKCYLSSEGAEVELHYHSMAFIINWKTKEQTPLKIIATRDMFPETESKWKRVADVLFTSGIEELENGKVRLYTGISDCRIGSVVIKNPVKEL
jgi:hypothetical protein